MGPQLEWSSRSCPCTVVLLSAAFLGTQELVGQAQTIDTADSGFHLFDPDAGFPGLEPAPRLENLYEALTPGEKPRKRFFLAAGEVVFFNMLPWIYGRFLHGDDYSSITPSTWATNLKNLPSFYRTFDQDSFQVNQVAHPYHGSLYFNSARSNGYSFWQSIPFALGGSLMWETFFENELVDINDVYATTIGGTTLGEVFYRSSRMILDDQATGVARVLRELGALALNPAGAVTRMVTGEMWRTGPNPDDRFPSPLVFVIDPGYQHVNVGETNQGVLTAELRYGDAFVGAIARPFDVFDAELELVQGDQTTLTEFRASGLLSGSDVWCADANELRMGVFLTYGYQNRLQREFQDETIGLRLLTRRVLSSRLEIRTDVEVGVNPLSAVESNYPEENREARSHQTSTGIPTIGRTYDYAPGGLAEAGARLRGAGDRDLLAIDYRLQLVRSVNGVSRNTRLQRFSAEGQVPVQPDFAVGGGWTWDERLASYDELPAVRRVAGAWRVFLSWILR